MLILIFCLLTFLLNFFTALFNDPLDVHNSLTISVVLSLGVCPHKRPHPCVHGVCHVVLFVLENRVVGLVEVCALLMHLFTVPKELGLVSHVVISERDLLVL